MGGYAPTIGIMGAVIGLIQVLGNLADPNELGAGIATAFVATIYGVGFANLLFLPIADRLRSQVLRYAGADDLFIEGLIAIADGEHPRSIEMRLRGLVAGN
jgi:chemotaxis protein MotA